MHACVCATITSSETRRRRLISRKRSQAASSAANAGETLASQEARIIRSGMPEAIASAMLCITCSVV